MPGEYEVWRMAMRFFTLTILLSASMLLQGCGDSNPTEEQARVFLAKEVQELLSDGRAGGAAIEFKLKKTNGVKMNLGGQEMYIIEFDAEAVFPKGLQKDLWIGMYGGRVPPRPAGGSFPLEVKKISFEKTEKGWRATRVLRPEG
jgi:hypothetical protein